MYEFLAFIAILVLRHLYMSFNSFCHGSYGLSHLWVCLYGKLSLSIRTVFCSFFFFSYDFCRAFDFGTIVFLSSFVFPFSFRATSVVLTSWSIWQPSFWDFPALLWITDTTDLIWVYFSRQHSCHWPAQFWFHSGMFSFRVDGARQVFSWSRRHHMPCNSPWLLSHRHRYHA